MKKTRTRRKRASKLHAFRIPAGLSGRLSQEADDRETSEAQVVIAALKRYFATQREEPQLSAIITSLTFLHNKADQILGIIDEEE